MNVENGSFTGFRIVLFSFSRLTTFYYVHFKGVFICAPWPSNKLFLIRPASSLCPWYLTRLLALVF